MFDDEGNLVQTPLVPTPEPPRLTEARATAIFLAYPKVRDWLDRYPKRGRVTEATFDDETRLWRVKAWWGDAGQIADGRVEDASGRVTEAWTGPQVAWKMARGYPGAFGGKEINRALVWLLFCGAFFVGLADFRRPLAPCNLDLLALLSFSISLHYFNKGDIFTSVPPASRSLYVIARHGSVRATVRLGTIRLARLGAGRRSGVPRRISGRPQHRVVERDRRIGYAGVIGGQRIANGEAPPWPHACPGRSQTVRDRPTPRARSASACRRTAAASRRTTAVTRTARSRTSRTSPAISRWAGAGAGQAARREVHDARSTSSASSASCSSGGVLGARLAATLALRGPPPVHPIRLELEHERHDPAGVPRSSASCCSPRRSCAAGSRACRLDEVRALIVAPALGDVSRRPHAIREKLVFALGFAAATVVAFSILLLEPNVLDAARTFWDRNAWLAAGPRVAVLDLGLGLVPRAEFPTSRSRTRP